MYEKRKRENKKKFHQNQGKKKRKEKIPPAIIDIYDTFIVLPFIVNIPFP